MNEMFNCEGPLVMDVDAEPCYTTGFWKKGWNHTDEARAKIGEGNKRYTPEEKIEATRASRKRRNDKWNAANPENKKECGVRWREKNREKARQYAREYYAKHKDVIKEKYREKNK